MGSLPRRADILGLCGLLLDRVLDSNATWVSMPVADYAVMLGDGNYDKTIFPVLEGGDVIVLGKKILVGKFGQPRLWIERTGLSLAQGVSYAAGLRCGTRAADGGYPAS